VKRLAVLTLLLLAGVAKPPATMSIAPVAFPYGHTTVNPYVVEDGDGFDLSWVDGRTLEFAHFDGVKWSRWNRIAHGEMLENRADYPSIAVSGRNVFAQWREKAGKGRRIRHLTGCPVNGPRIVTNGAHAAVAWYTAANGTPSVLVAFSHDGGATFGAPIRVDAGHPAGRADLSLLGDGSALVTWVESTSTIVARRVTESGALDPIETVGTSHASIGFPRIARSSGAVLAAWNGDDGVHLAIIKPRIR